MSDSPSSAIESEMESFNLYGTIFDAEKVADDTRSIITIKINGSVVGDLILDFSHNFADVEVADKNYSGLLYTLWMILDRKMRVQFDTVCIAENEYII